MLTVLKQRNFALLWSGGLISMIGNWILIAALPFHVYELTGSALATSGVLMAYIVPGVLFSSFAGVFVDRWDRKKIMVAVSLLQAIAILLLVFVRSVEWVWVIYVAIFIEASLSNLFKPAENALLPTLVGKEHLMAANSLNALNDNLARLVGPAIGGLLLGLTGLSSVVILDAVSYLLAAGLILLVQAPQMPASKPAETGPGEIAPFRQIWREWLAGLKYVRRSQLLTGIFLVMGFALLGDAIISAVLVVFVQDDMGLSAVEFGWMMTARGLGGLLGGLLIAQISRKIKPEKLAALGMALSGVGILLIVAIPTLWLALPLLILLGIFALTWIVSVQTLLQQGTEDAYRGRVFGAFGTSSTLLMLVGSAIGGGLADLLGAQSLMGAASLLFVLAGFAAWQVFQKAHIYPGSATHQPLNQ
jgi:MFS family permease